MHSSKPTYFFSISLFSNIKALCFKNLISDLPYQDMKSENIKFIFSYKDGLETLQSKNSFSKQDTIEIFQIMLNKDWFELLNAEKKYKDPSSILYKIVRMKSLIINNLIFFFDFFFDFF